MPGLNRTSVGLKALLLSTSVTVPEMPQSNQRGIESSLFARSYPLTREPQSNQRGIESLDRGPHRLAVDLASIEPAWD